ncbi:MAG: trypsin-like serine protease [Myxococcales bacterium]|nr:trypsin-like serine protease [Myxococcales bacterium]
MGRVAYGALLACVLGCDAPSGDTAVAAIIGGTPTTGDPAVVGLVIGGEVACTGTLIDPRVVVTAAHCTILAPTAVVVGADRATGQEVAVATALTHPDFGYAGLVNDLGLLILADDLTLPPVARGATPPAVDAMVRLVGFGATTADGTGGRKHEGWARIAAVAADELTLAPAPATPCHGDSGGPVLADLGAGEQLIGVVSSGDAACTTAQLTRVDVHAALIADVLARAHAAGRAGDACWSDAGCAAGACAWFDAASHGVCAPACDAGCPDGWRCATTTAGARACQPPGPLPGAVGATCGDDLDCVDAACLLVDGEDARQCWPTCVGGGAACTAAGDACRPTDRPDVEACVPTAAAGCAVGGDRAGAALALVIGAALARRRRYSASSAR